MAFFQNSVLKKHLQGQDAETLKTAYQKFTTYFHNSAIQQNIRDAKEEQFQEGFLRELFVNILGYKLNPQPDYNLTTELKNEKGVRKCDGAILQDGKALGVIELKGTDTKNLDKINEQAFNYKNNQTGCAYVITSNFEKLRFFIHNAVEHIEFNVFTLSLEEYKVLWLCLNADNLLSGVPLKESLLAEENITKQLYKDYSAFKTDLWRNMSKNHPQDDQLMLFRKTQKLLDRFLFIFFAEDSGLLPPNSNSKIIEKWKQDTDWGEDRKLYDIYKQYFGFINSGRPAKGDRAEIFGYNGGLFQDDLILENIKIDDEILLKHTEKLTAYDFQSEVDVNILGHIFENSLNEIENITAELEGQEIDKSKSKRKKDGVFYTPKYITKYIVDNTVGKLCEEKKAELNITDERFGQSGKRSKKGIADLKAYKDWLLDLKICDPACGSGAFLNQALEFLIDEHLYMDELTAQYHKSPLVLSDIETQILEQNIYGVDINEESIEIAKLSLWLRTAQRGRKLTSLNHNIKCGNSLIDNPAVAGEKAFHWQKEFPEVFQKKEKKAWHVTTATHNSRYSQRMFDNYVKTGEPVWLSEEEEIIVTETIAEIVEKDKLNVIAYNICGDHMHLLLVCIDEELPKIVQKIKAMSARACNIAMGRTVPAATANGLMEHAPFSITPTPTATSEHAPTSPIPNPPEKGEHAPQIPSRGKTQHHLWTQKFGSKEITGTKQFENTINYIVNNRKKHELPANKELQSLIEKMTCPVRHAFRTEYEGGFDVVIGNPPYGILIDKKTQKFYTEHFPLTQYKTNLYILFIERMLQVFTKGIVHFIIPKSLLFNTYYEAIRRELICKTELNEIYTITEKVFEDAEVGSSLLLQFAIKNKPDPKSKVRLAVADKIRNFVTGFGVVENIVSQDFFLSVPNCEISVVSSDSQSILKKLHNLNPIKEYYSLKNGLNPGNIKHILISESKETDLYKPIIWGKEITRYNIEWGGEYVNYDVKLGEKIVLDDVKSKQGMNKQNRIDFALRSPDLFETKKIVVRKTGDSLIGCLDNNNYYFDTLVHGIYKKENGFELEPLLALLNSRPATKFYRLLHDIKGKVFAKISLDNLGSFPIPENIASKEIGLKEKVEFLLGKTKEIEKARLQFLSFLQSKVEIAKLSTKLQNWHELEFKDFLKELKKAKVQLSLSEEAEWMQYFNEQKLKALELKAKIEKTDQHINKMVYQLYGLTEEEIAIVKGSTD